MPRDLDHLPLPVWQEPLPVRKHRGGGTRGQRDRQRHGRTLDQQVDEVQTELDNRTTISPPQINPKLIFKVRFNRDVGRLNEDQLRRMELSVLAHDPEQAVVVFPSRGSLDELRRRVREYAGVIEDGHTYAEIDAIEEIVPLGPEDRIGPRLRDHPLDESETASLDIELWHTGDRQECRRHITEISDYLDTHDLRITDDYVGTGLCLVRARVDRQVLGALLDTDYIKEIDRRPAPTFDMLPLVRLNIEDIEQPVDEVADDLIGVVVIDSGVMGQHPLLGPALGDAQVFPDAMRARITGGAEDGDQQHGHGTAVAGIAVYNDVGECIERRAFEPTASLFSARVTDDNNQYDENELLEHQLERAVQYFLRHYPSVRVVNISLGDRAKIYSDGEYQFRFAAAIDELAYRHRDREVVFVVSAGNYWPHHLDGEQMLEEYPNYLLNDPESRLIDPATAALALTVGGISYGHGREMREYDRNMTDQPVAGERGWPAPFTRTGWGVDQAIKPDVVDFAGDLRFQRGNVFDGHPQHVGVPSTHRDFAPPTGRLFRTVSGTSYAAPRVANLAARLFREFPNASSNLIRALIAASAHIPNTRPPALAENAREDDDILRLYGYGQPGFDRARWSSEQEVLLTADDTIEIGSFRLYEIPSLPEEFLTATGSGFLDVTLAFDPPTRHTRGDSYIGVAMEAQLFRNLRPESVADVLRVWETEEKAALEGGKPPSKSTIREYFDVTASVNLQPGVTTRKRGTLQRAWKKVSRTTWRYDGDSLVLAVLCRRRWAPTDTTHQRFAVVVSIAHENEEIELHTHLRERVRQPRRTRVRV